MAIVDSYRGIPRERLRAGRAADEASTQICAGPCRRELPVDAFPEYLNRRRNAVYRRPRCKECAAAWQRDHARTDHRRRQQRDAWLRRKYGITLDQYDRMLVTQGGGCAICGAEPGARSLSVDHCHETGSVRGLLCGSCNSGLGQFQDDPNLLQAAVAYLESQ